jgi:release factor glutamine methyltransferase
MGRAGDTAETLARRLRRGGSVYAEQEAELLICESGSDEQLDGWIGRRLAGEPLEQILGWAQFYGLRIRVSPGVFVPRRRTEYLVELALTVSAEPDVVVDLCCGSAAIGTAIAAHQPAAAVFAADIDPVAVECAGRNLSPDRVFVGDLFRALPTALLGQVELLTVNAPYVPSAAVALMPTEARLHENLVALDGGPDGLAIHRGVGKGAAQWLSPTGTLLIETSRRQADTTARILRDAGLTAEINHSHDYDATVVTATRASAASG